MPTNALAKYQQKTTRRNLNVQKDATVPNTIPQSVRVTKRPVIAIQGVRREKLPSRGIASARKPEKGHVRMVISAMPLRKATVDAANVPMHNKQHFHKSQMIRVS